MNQATLLLGEGRPPNLPPRPFARARKKLLEFLFPANTLKIAQILKLVNFTNEINFLILVVRWDNLSY